MKTTASWLPSLITAAIVLATTFSPQIQEYLSAYPVVATVLAGVYAVISHVLPSPVASGEKDK